MKKIIRRTRLAILLMMVVVFTSTTSIYASEGSKEMDNRQATQEELHRINELKGKDISYYEYYEYVYPDVADSFTQEEKAVYKSIRFPWEEILSNSEAPATRGVGTNKSSIVQYSDKSLKGTSKTTYTGSEAVTMISIQCFILDSGDNIVATGSSAKFNKKDCSASATLNSPRKGTKYRAKGTHVITFESGVIPPSVSQVTFSGYYTAK